ncbi:MAG: hypothetical protein IJC54_07040, partial [Clostridia bacterium]|nr:hypothetical protein [Clostridia bacterium]
LYRACPAGLLGPHAREAGPARRRTRVFQPVDTLSLDLSRADFSFIAVPYYTPARPVLQAV